MALRRIAKIALLRAGVALGAGGALGTGVAFIACASDPASTVDASADASPDVDGAAVDAWYCVDACPSCDGAPCACVPDAVGFTPPGYVATVRAIGACHRRRVARIRRRVRGGAEWRDLRRVARGHIRRGTRCLLGDTLPGPFRKSTRNFLEVSPGTCGQVLAGEVFGANGGCRRPAWMRAATWMPMPEAGAIGDSSATDAVA